MSKPTRPTPRPIRALHALDLGRTVWTDDGTAWRIVSRSYLGTLTAQHKKWVWLQQIQAPQVSRHVCGADLYALRVVLAREEERHA